VHLPASRTVQHPTDVDEVKPIPLAQFQIFMTKVLAEPVVRLVEAEFIPGLLSYSWNL
jgi:hypothetical protein